VTKAVEQLLDEARASLRRISPAEAADAQAAGALLVDIRPAEQRAREGEVPGARVIERNVLEWWLDPASPDRIAEIIDHDQSSSCSARRVTRRAWRRPRSRTWGSATPPTSPVGSKRGRRPDCPSGEARPGLVT
jgi:rhodanese-related sulfurtransferase